MTSKIATEKFDISELKISTDIYYGTKSYIDQNKIFKIDPIVCYDHFITNNTEYILLPRYTTDKSIDVLKKNGFRFVINGINKHNQPLVLAYRNSALPNTFTESHSLVMCVYFLQNPNEEIIQFCDYYFAQGIDKIFFYYCGKLVDRPNLPVYPNVTYLEWDYIHWLIRSSFKREHYSQVPLFNMFAKKISPLCEWSFFVDLDEFIKPPFGGTLKDYLTSEKAPESHIFTQHRWSEINYEQRTIRYEKTTSEKRRGKTILCGKKITRDLKMGNHSSDECINSNELLLLHASYDKKFSKSDWYKQLEPLLTEIYNF